MCITQHYEYFYRLTTTNNYFPFLCVCLLNPRIQVSFYARFIDYMTDWSIHDELFQLKSIHPLWQTSPEFFHTGSADF